MQLRNTGITDAVKSSTEGGTVRVIRKKTMRVKRKAGLSYMYDNLSFTTLAATVAACAHGTVYNNTTLLLLLLSCCCT